MKKFAKRLVLFVVVVTVIFLGWLVFFFASNEAPLMYGEVRYHIKYNESQELDVYFPTREVKSPIPVILFIHGGAWIGGTKAAININRFNQAINQLRESGYAVVSPDYTLARDWQTPFPACIVDAFDALEWIKTHAEENQFDLKNVGVFGESAGAHIAMMLAFSEPQDFGLSYQKTDFRYVVDVYGPNDLFELYRMPAIDSVRSVLAKLPGSLQESLDLPRMLFGFDPEKDSLRAQQLMALHSPVRYLSQGLPPVLMIHGDQDQIVPVGQSIRLQRKLDSLSVSNSLHVLEGVDHAFRGASDSQKKQVQDWIAKFIIENYHLDN